MAFLIARRALFFIAFGLLFPFAFSLPATAQQTNLLVDIDHRPQTSLDGTWHYIADPYRDGWGGNPDHPSLHGYAQNAHYVPGGQAATMRSGLG